MKKKSLFVLSTCSFLLFGTLVSCSNESTPFTQAFLVNETTSSDYDIVGLETTGYAQGRKVTFGVVVKNDQKVISEVKAGSETVTHEGGNVYSFVMPAKDVTIEVILANLEPEKTDEVLGLADALEKASEGVSFETVFVEKQTYIDNSGEVSSKSRYARKTTSNATGEYNLVTRYKSVYDYNKDNFENNTPIDVSETEAETITMYSKIPNTTNLGTTALGIDNVVHYYDVLDSATEVNLDWYETFNNPFNLLSATDFVEDETEEGLFHLKTEDINNRLVCDALALIVFGDIQQQYTLEEFSVKVVDGEFTTYSGHFADPQFEWYRSEVSFTGEFKGFGSTVFEAPKPVEGASDATFDEAITTLKEGNYTVSVTEDYTSAYYGRTVDVTKGYSDGGDSFLQEFYATNADMSTAEPYEAYYYLQQSEIGWGDIEEFSIQRGVKIKEEYYTFSSDLEDVKIKDNLLPTFAISSALFDKEDNKYTLKSSENLPYYMMLGSEEVFSPFTSLSIRNLEITIGEDSVTFVTDDTYGTITTVEYSKIGTTTVPEITIKTTTEDLKTWEDYFKTENDVTLANNTIPSEIMNIVPTPKVSFGGNVTNVAPNYAEVDEETGFRSMQIVCALDDVGDYVDVQYDDLLVYFSQAVTKEGFIYDESNTYEYAFIKEMNVLGVDSTVEISFGGYGNYFVVQYDIAPIVEEEPEV